MFNLIGGLILLEVDGGSIVTLPGAKLPALKSEIAKLLQDVLFCY